MIRLWHVAAEGLLIISDGRSLISAPRGDLEALRLLVAGIPPSAANDEDFERIESGPWAASGSSFGIALMHSSGGCLFLEGRIGGRS